MGITKTKIARTSLLALSLLIINCQLLIGTVRYVSHSGCNTPPYTSWETAADSIMFAINISQFGDTIYVANGVYEEQLVMIPGLSLIGAGMDSCTIDTRSLVNSGSWAIIMADSCLIKEFNIIVSNSREARGIYSGYGNSIIEYNKIVNTHTCIYISNSNTYLLQNILINAENGIELFNSNSKVINNIMFDVRSGVEIDAFTGDYYPVVEKNIIRCTLFGILVQFSSSPTIRNNTIFLNGNLATGYRGSGSDSVWIYNNAIIAEGNLPYADGLSNSRVPTFEYNNLVIGEIETGIYCGEKNIVKNNLILNANRGIRNEGDPGQEVIIQYNNSWSNTINYNNFTPDSTNLSVDPMVVSEDSLDFHLQMFSPLIDAGDPNILDRDGSRSDIGLYGGPYGWTYTYQDLAPRPPHNVTAVIEDGLVKLTWNKNTEADFSHYRIYRDTVSIIIYDSTKIIGETSDTVFYDNFPPVNRETSFYYVITAFDNQENQSYPSEEINVTVTGLSEHPPIGYDDYRLLSNYPNPFNPSTIIPYRLKEGGYVKLYIYDIKGELVRTLVNQWQDKGYYEVIFHPNGKERERANSFKVPMGRTYSDIATGIYLYRIEVIGNKNMPVFSDMGKMILLK